jgi:hypothetical protein
MADNRVITREGNSYSKLGYRYLLSRTNVIILEVRTFASEFSRRGVSRVMNTACAYVAGDHRAESELKHCKGLERQHGEIVGAHM